MRTILVLLFLVIVSTTTSTLITYQIVMWKLGDREVAKPEPSKAVDAGPSNEDVVKAVTERLSSTCNEAIRGLPYRFSYTFFGTVIGRSIEGNAGVFLVSIRVREVGDPVQSTSQVAVACGHANTTLNSGQETETKVAAVFRRYDSGWKLENYQLKY